MIAPNTILVHFDQQRFAPLNDGILRGAFFRLEWNRRQPADIDIKALSLAPRAQALYSIATRVRG